MSNLYWILLILVLSCIVYLLLAFIIFPDPVQRIGKEEYSLTNTTSVISNEQLKGPWTSGSGSSLIFYINPKIIDRTAQSGNEYATVVKIGGKQSFQVLVAPDAGRSFYMAPARFEIYVRGDDKPEYAEIPKFPLQRWSTVVIVKFGRKFNIYLNGKLVVTHVCESMPLFDDTQPLKVGDPRLSGTICLMSLSSTAMTTDQVRNLVRTTVDTSGKPHMPMNITKLFSFGFQLLPNAWWCSDNSCKRPKQAGPLEKWSSPYA